MLVYEYMPNSSLDVYLFGLYTSSCTLLSFLALGLNLFCSRSILSLRKKKKLLEGFFSSELFLFGMLRSKETCTN